MAEERVQNLILGELQTLRTEQKTGFESVRAEFNQRLDRLVTHDAFTSEQRRVDDRLVDLVAVISQERADRQSALQTERTDRLAEIGKISKRVDQTTSNLRWVAASIAIPVLLFIGNIFLPPGGAS